MIIFALRDTYVERLHSGPQVALSFRDLCRTMFNAFTNEKGELLPEKTFQYLDVVYISSIDDAGFPCDFPADFPIERNSDDALVFTIGDLVYSPVRLLIEKHKNNTSLV